MDPSNTVLKIRTPKDVHELVETHIYSYLISCLASSTCDYVQRLVHAKFQQVQLISEFHLMSSAHKAVLALNKMAERTVRSHGLNDLRQPAGKSPCSSVKANRLS